MNELYTFEKLCAPDRLELKIRDSSIVTALDYITTVDSPATTNIYFKAALSEDDETTLNTLVDEHVSENLPENLVSKVRVSELPDPLAFAQPTHRTKRDSTDIVTIAKNTSEVIDYKLTEERYTIGGNLQVENAEFGDYVTAAVCDVDEVIPEPLRATLCENWPIVATYLEKAYVRISTPGSIVAGSVSSIEVLTHPLIAKITANLYLRLTYHAVDAGLSRRAGVTYYLLKKL